MKSIIFSCLGNMRTDAKVIKRKLINGEKYDRGSPTLSHRRFIDYTLLFYKNIVFPAQAEYSSFSANVNICNRIRPIFTRIFKVFANYPSPVHLFLN